MASITFTNPEFLAFLLALPVIAVVHILLYTATKRKGMVFANFTTLKRVTGKDVMTRDWGMLVLRLVSVGMLVVALAGPLLWYEGEVQDTDYVLAIDTSASMTADDFIPTRLDAAKAVAKEFVERQVAATSIGVISFTGLVTVEEPLTEDMVAARQAVERIRIQTIAGTDISGALVTGTNLLLGSDKGRAIILITDGSATAGAFREDPVVQGTAYAVKHGITVHTIGIGKEGTVPAGYLPRFYNVSAVYDSDTLSYISEQTGGLSLTAEDAVELSEAFVKLEGQSQSANRTYALDLWLLLVGVMLLIFEWGLANTRYRLIP